MSNRSLFKVLLILLTVSFLLFGCEKTEKQQMTKPAEKAELKSNTEGESLVKEKPTIKIEKLKGTWIGTLDKRKTTLVVTEEDSANFKGKITINYRTPINQEIEGSYNSEDDTITMRDLLHSRYKGTYSAKLVENEMAIRGVFTTLVDKKNFDFILTKQK